MRTSMRFVATLLAMVSLTASACTSPATPYRPGPSDPAPSAPASAGAPRAPSRITDVNCDGIVDLVMGSVTEQGGDGATWHAGSVTVRYGGSDVVQSVDQLAFGDKPSKFAGGFGGSVVAGDLNGDGCSDVVVGDAEAEDGAASPVWALWGSRTGISADRSAVLISGESGLGHQLAFVPLPSPVLVVSSEDGPRLYPVNTDGTLGTFRLLALKSRTKPGRFPDDGYGAALSASGNLLVVSSPQFDDEGYGYGGEVWVVRLLPGLRHEATWVGQDSPGVPGSYRLGDGFGTSVSLFHGYLAIGVPGAAVAAGSGRVHVFRVTGTQGPPKVRYLRSIDARPAACPAHVRASSSVAASSSTVPVVAPTGCSCRPDSPTMWPVLRRLSRSPRPKRARPRCWRTR